MIENRQDRQPPAGFTTPGPGVGRARTPAIDFAHRRAFFVGTTAVAVGVGLHLPMFFDSARMHYRLAGMSPDPAMLAGMALIAVGLVAAGYGIIGPIRPRLAHRHTGFRVCALDDASLRPAHLVLILVMSVAVTVDAMKVIALGFVTPGMAIEYGLRSASHPVGSVPVALLPLCGLAGTVVGSLIWGRLGDLVGRRASILLAAILFVATSICGAMPSYEWNFAMCFLMGVGVGGMLPITLTLIAELMPARHRGWAMVLIGGELALAYALTSWLAGLLTPSYGWRILWLIGLPTGVLLIALQRYIPESPRFLLLCGRHRDAEAVMARYGAGVTRSDAGEHDAPGWSGTVVQDRLPTGTMPIIALLALSAGLVTYGLQLWLPTNLEHLGFTALTSASLLRDSALFGLPVTVLAAVLYARWSTRGTLLVLTLITAVALLVFALAGDGIVRHPGLLRIVTVVPTAMINSVLAAALAYAAESFPTDRRATAAGVVGALSKVGGVGLTALVVGSVAPASIRTTALLGAAPLLLGAVAVLRAGVDTRARRLDDLAVVGRGGHPSARLGADPP